jgi:hypothetical protein
MKRCGSRKRHMHWTNSDMNNTRNVGVSKGSSPKERNFLSTRWNSECGHLCAFWCLHLVDTQGMTPNVSFRNYKPSESDVGDDSDSEEDENPANWFHDEEDDGIKGQQIVQPDVEDYSSVIRIDERRAYAGYSTFYEPRDGD